MVWGVVIPETLAISATVAGIKAGTNALCSRASWSPKLRAEFGAFLRNYQAAKLLEELTH